MEFIHHPKILLFIGIISLPLYATLARGFWGEKFESLSDALKYLMWPDIYSLFRGKYWEDLESTELVYFYIFLCVGWACAITEFIARHVI